MQPLTKQILILCFFAALIASMFTGHFSEFIEAILKLVSGGKA